MASTNNTIPKVLKPLDNDLLVSLDKRVEFNKAKKDEYELLDNGIESAFGKNNTILSILEQYNINDYDEYISERKKNINNRMPEVEGEILGKILGTIRALKRILQSNF